MDMRKLKKLAGIMLTEAELKLVPKEEEGKKEETRDFDTIKHEVPAKKEAEGSAAGEKFRAAARAWMAANQGHTRKAFITWATGRGKTAAHANTVYYTIKGKKAAESEEMCKEVYMIQHPQAPKFVLAENPHFGRFDWVDLASTEFAPVIFETQLEADEYLDGLEASSNIRGQVLVVSLED